MKAVAFLRHLIQQHRCLKKDLHRQQQRLTAGQPPVAKEDRTSIPSRRVGIFVATMPEDDVEVTILEHSVDLLVMGPGSVRKLGDDPD